MPYLLIIWKGKAHEAHFFKTKPNAERAAKTYKRNFGPHVRPWHTRIVKIGGRR